VYVAATSVPLPRLLLRLHQATRCSCTFPTMFHAVTWESKPKKLPQKPPTVLTRGAEFGLVQLPGTARFHRAATRLRDAFTALRAVVSCLLCRCISARLCDMPPGALCKHEYLHAWYLVSHICGTLCILTCCALVHRDILHTGATNFSC